MFDIGFSELFVIAVVALLVLGPERLPKATRMVGLWVRRARAQWYAVKSELESELADEDMRRSLHRAQEELREAQAALQRDGERLRMQMHDLQSQAIRAGGMPGEPVEPLPHPAAPPEAGLPPADDHGLPLHDAAPEGIDDPARRSNGPARDVD